MPDESEVIEVAIRFVEQRQNGKALNVEYPDKSDRSVKAVDRRFSIGEKVFVLEHSRTESFPGQISTGFRWKEVIDELKKRLDGKLPKDGYFRLASRADSMNFSSKDVQKKAVNNLEAWIRSKAPILKAASGPLDKGSKITEMPPGIDAEFTLLKISTLNLHGQLSSGQVIGEIEGEREKRMDQLLSNKLQKLSDAKAANPGSFSVLVIESNDIGLGNAVVIRDAFGKAIQKKQFQQIVPDSIYLIETDSGFFMYAFRENGSWFQEFCWAQYGNEDWSPLIFQT